MENKSKVGSLVPGETVRATRKVVSSILESISPGASSKASLIQLVADLLPPASKALTAKAKRQMQLELDPDGKEKLQLLLQILEGLKISAEYYGTDSPEVLDGLLQEEQENFEKQFFQRLGDRRRLKPPRRYAHQEKQA